MSESLGGTLYYYWRVLATGFCFLMFAPGTVVALLIILPLRVLPLRKELKQSFARAVISQIFSLYIQLMVCSGVLSLEIKGLEKLRPSKSRLVIANHPTLIDAVVLLSILPELRCVVKGELTQNSVMREVIYSAGYISNSEPQALLAECAEVLGNGGSLLLFPEGTRSTPGEPLKLLRGAAQIALRIGKDFTPVLITCSPPSLLKGQKWYQVPRDGPVRMVFEVQDDLKVAPFQTQNEGLSLRSRKLTRHLTDYFQEHLHWAADLQRER